jgi:hypothetical protein
MEETGLAYAPIMDDAVILAPTRWEVREAIRLVNQTLAELKLRQHPDKTFLATGQGAQARLRRRQATPPPARMPSAATTRVFGSGTAVGGVAPVTVIEKFSLV